MTERLRVLITADDLLTRSGLATLLTERTDHQVVGQLGSAELAENAAAFAPHLILWDMGWQSALSIERLADLDDPPAPVLALLHESVIAPDAWIAGARGIFLRATRLESVITALSAVAAGLIVIDPALSESLLTPRQPSSLPAPTESLTPRELEVLQHLAGGLANKAVARRMNITESTVKFHVNAILGKLGAQSRTDAVVRASRLGLILL